jgi:hypothetical protein
LSKTQKESKGDEEQGWELWVVSAEVGQADEQAKIQCEQEMPERGPFE